MPLEACPIVKSADVYALAPAPEALEEARVAWSAQTTVTLDAEVVEHNAELGIYKLAAREPAADHPFLLLHTGGDLPIEIGKRYRFTAHNDIAGQPPAGAALRIDDEAGPLFLGISARETDGADRRLLGATAPASPSARQRRCVSRAPSTPAATSCAPPRWRSAAASRGSRSWRDRRARWPRTRPTR